MASANASSFARGKRGNFDNRREEVLRTAARLFSEHGFRQATLEDVARALNITRPALYHYARSKDELAIQCAARAREEIAEVIAEADRFATGREQMVAFFRRYAEIACEDFGRFFVLVNEREFSPELRESSRPMRRDIQDAVRRMVDAGAADGSLRRLDSGDVARALFGAVNAIPHWHRPGGGRSPGQIAEDFLTMFLDGLAP
jgi:AcrR family transcriptional regulator